jgi:tRNA-specific 2-thiouridylase
LGVSADRRRYVLRIVPGANDVVLGDLEDLQAEGLVASRVNWLIDPPSTGFECQIKIRYRHTPVAGTIRILPGDAAQAVFAEPQNAVTPGQAVVFYDGSRVLGGGWIEEATPHA